MKFVIDTNIIISALIKPGKTREIIFENFFNFITPAYTLTEIEKYKREICIKSGMSVQELEEVINLLFKHIKILNPKVYSHLLLKASKLILDIKDIPFLASALSLNCPIWSDDKHFQKQKEIKILTTKDILDLYCK
jgi:predicted nucleic acid-binding protein